MSEPLNWRVNSVARHCCLHITGIGKQFEEMTDFELVCKCDVLSSVVKSILYFLGSIFFVAVNLSKLQQ